MSSNCNTLKRLKQRSFFFPFFFYSSPWGSRELDEYSWNSDEFCCLQLRASLKALMLLLLSQEVPGTEPHGPQHSASTSNYQLSSEIINLLCWHKHCNFRCPSLFKWPYSWGVAGSVDWIFFSSSLLVSQSLNKFGHKINDQHATLWNVYMLWFEIDEQSGLMHFWKEGMQPFADFKWAEFSS